jgi:hypothetical protein
MRVRVWVCGVWAQGGFADELYPSVHGCIAIICGCIDNSTANKEVEESVRVLGREEQTTACFFGISVWFDGDVDGCQVSPWNGE